ncbi:MAG: hypothetical protein A2493_01730 [Candidatus Magasanikbacteria bacterium RIFOXYC12_FULL_33_11]|uniref:Uncharacterized protein n=1 Tax=Candidatus Magasanikbacteria bacterium RIFOXYC12_FULL_33_11 TaxID=1798701 RepID=A0A1F6NLU0_9BACT|nr:MAG: hypothetical protein A2493_01730 [Candidatus Magasanikbacteria bacterium RIFOXYC12_FULL_33_11]
MPKKLYSKTLLEYKLFQLSPFSSLEKKASLKSLSKMDQLIDTFGNEPIELCGIAPLFFVFPLFLSLRQVTTELIYRTKLDESAIVIFSLLDEGKYIRPYNVGHPIQWTPDELKKFNKFQKKDTQKELAFNLSEMWQQSVDASPQNVLKYFLTILYSLSPSKDRVILQGLCPIGPALLTLNWFMLDSNSILYEDIVLK